MKIKYLKCRPKSHPFPMVAWLIMLFQGQNPFNKKSSSHRALWFFDLDLIIDSTGGKGVHENKEIAFLKKYVIVDFYDYEIDITNIEYHDWFKSIESRKYDYLDIFGDALRKVFSFLSFKKLGHNWKKMVCNEVALHFVQYFFHKEVGDPDTYDLISTDKVMEELE